MLAVLWSGIVKNGNRIGAVNPISFKEDSNLMGNVLLLRLSRSLS